LVPAILSSVGDLALEHRRAQWIGIVNGGASIGWIVGPILGGLLYDRYGYVLPFSASIAMQLVTLLLALFLVPETHTSLVHPGDPRLAWAHGFRVLSAMPAFYLIMLISFGVTFAWAFIEPQFMFYAYHDLTWSSSELGLIMSTFGLACAFGEFSLGRLSDRLGRKPVVVLGLALFSAQFVGLVIFREVTWIVVSFIIAGLGNAIFDPALNALILDLTPSEYTAGMIGLKGTVGSFGNMLGPATVVLLTPFVGPQIVFLVSAVFVLLLPIACGFTPGAPRRNEVPSHGSNAAVSR
jgi:MFS family permease